MQKPDHPINGKHPEHAFLEFTFRRFFDDGGHPYPSMKEDPSPPVIDSNEMPTTKDSSSAPVYVWYLWTFDASYRAWLISMDKGSQFITDTFGHLMPMNVLYQLHHWWLITVCDIHKFQISVYVQYCWWKVLVLTPESFQDFSNTQSLQHLCRGKHQKFLVISKLYSKGFFLKANLLQINLKVYCQILINILVYKEKI